MLIKRKEMDMANKRRKYTTPEKVRILRLHLVEKRPVSDLCDELGLNPNVLYRWQKQFFENGAAALINRPVEAKTNASRDSSIATPSFRKSLLKRTRLSPRSWPHI